MFVEKRAVKGKKKFYLVHTDRFNGKIRRISRYLGADLSKEELERLRPAAEKLLTNHVEALKKIGDPLLSVLNETELDLVRSLEKKADFKVSHLSDEEWKRFSEVFAYHTNAIEGSEVTKSEVKNILENNQWPSDKSKEDVSETYGVSEAIDFMRKSSVHISADFILELHRIVFKNSKAFAGKFREKGIEVVIKGPSGEVIHRGAPSESILSLLKELIKWYEKNRENYPALVLAVVVHNQFENIHPFADGNGRIGRLLLNNILVKNKYPPVNINVEDRKEYYSALQDYDEKHDIRPMIELLMSEYKKMKK